MADIIAKFVCVSANSNSSREVTGNLWKNKSNIVVTQTQRWSDKSNHDGSGGVADGEREQRRFWATHVNRKGFLTGSDAFSFIIRLHATKFVLLSVFILTETIWPKHQAEPLPMNEKGPLPVDVRRSKTSL